MRIERSQNPPPISGLAVAALGFAIAALVVLAGGVAVIMITLNQLDHTI